MAVLALSCKGTWLMYDNSQTPLIYFQESVQTHSSSFALLADDEISVSTTVYVMGNPVDYDRTYAVEYIEAADTQKFTTGSVTYPVSTARPGVDFELDPLVIPAGAVNAKLSMTIHRTEEMLDKYLQIGIRLVSNDEFNPCATDSTSTQEVLTPEYYYYISDGEPACPGWWRNSSKDAPGWDYAWGNYYPDKFRKLLEYFHETEVTCPSFYEYAVEKLGYYLDSPDFDDKFWRRTYAAAWAKYVAMPLYDYYLKWYAEHPDDPNYEAMGDKNVNLNAHTGWGNPMSGTYGFLN